MTADGARAPEWAVAGGMSATLIAVSAVAAWLTRQPLVFPALGPTVYLLVESPLTRRASPRNTLVGHAIALVAGWSSLLLFGLRSTAPAAEVGVGPARIGAIVVALALTAALTVALGASHPPAAATALLVAMGTFRSPWQLVMLAAGTALLVMVGTGLNRLRGTAVPVWSPDEAETPG